MAKDDAGWSEWCRLTSADFQRAADRTHGRRAAKLSELAAHYDAQASGSDAAFAGNKPLFRRPFSRMPKRQ
jgi:hypothetical protein